MGLASGSLTIVLSLFDLRGAMLPFLGAFVFLSGAMYLGRAYVHRADPAYSDPAVVRLVASDLNFGYCWLALGLLLVLLGLVVRAPIVVPLAGAFVCGGLYLHGWTAGDAMVRREARLRIAGGSEWVEGSDPVRLLRRRAETGPLLLGARRLPSAFGRKRPYGQLSLFLSVTLLFIAYTGLAYGGMAAVDIFDSGVSNLKADERSGGTPSPELPGEGQKDDPLELPTYAELCPELPDPQDIGAGLGDLFEHDGAVAAGCGREALKIGPSTWMAPGYCGSELRSLAVVGEGRAPVLLYGAPARLGWERGLAGDLFYAEAAEPAGGEIVLLGTGDGSFSFVRTSPVLRQGDGEAVRCAEVDEVARPFAELPPPLTDLWIRQMDAQGAWSWPEPVPGSDDQVTFITEGQLPSSGGCEAEYRCRLEGPSNLPPSETGVSVTLANFAYLPPPLP